MKRLCLFVSLLLLCPMLGACSYSYLERQVYPICMSVELDGDGRYQVGIQAPQSSAEQATASYDILTATGGTLDDALRVLAASTPYPLNFCQLRLCLVGYGLAATTPLRPLLRTLFEMPTMRPDAYVMITLGSAAEVMSAQRPDFGMRLSTHLNLLFERLRQEDMLPDSTLSACVRELGDGRRDPLICICAVNSQLAPKEGNHQGSSSGGGSGGDGGSGGGGGDSGSPAFAVGEPWSNALLPEQIIAGMLPHSSVNPVEYLGSAAPSDGRVSGLLTAQETQVALRALREAEKRVAISGDSLQLQLILSRDTELYDRRDVLAKVMEKLQALDCDALGFCGAASTAFYTDAEWQAYQFSRRYAQAECVIQSR